MILILSQSPLEPTTEDVMDWLRCLGAPCVRLNGEDLDGDAAVTVAIDGLCVEVGIGGIGGIGGMGGLDEEGVELPLAAVRAVWFRRWLRERRHETVDLLELPSSAAVKLQHDIRRHLTLESRKLSDFLFAHFRALPWLSEPWKASPAKLDVLVRAARAGLATPATLVTTERERLRRFCAAHDGVITKPIGEAEIYLHEGERHQMYTAPLDLAAIDALPRRFPPSLFQERLEKLWEVRVFYLDGECHAMAIFSQADEQTRADFRNYNRARPNRCVPYRLPRETAARIQALMRDLELATGSLDLIHTPDGRDVFLEVNPVGQFGMVSKPCNYRLDRKVAELLIRKAEHGR